MVAGDSNNINDSVRLVKFRNYQPYDAKLRPIETEKILTNEENVTTEIVDIIKQELSKNSVQEFSVLPKKSNWDLKEQASNKIEKLRRRTQRAIVEILREKMAASGDDSD